MSGHLSLPQPSHRLVTRLSRSSLLLVLWLAVSQAQVRTTLTSDGTLGTTVTPHGTQYTITGGTRPGNGPNLFHSFDRFSVGTNETASFTGPAGITRILSRVTGGQRSEIDGTVQSTMPGAHLYLLNPSGVMFGPNARLDVSGSFYVSTADYLRLADGARFSVRLSETSTLTVAAPAAFGFLGPPTGPITMQGSALQVPAGQTLSVVGGDMAIEGNGLTITADSVPTLSALGGRIQLVSVASSGEVGVNRLESALDLRMEGFARLGRIDLSQGALVTVRSGGSRNAGEIEVRGGQLTLSGGSQLDASTQGARQGGTVTVVATEALTLTGSSSRLTSSTSGDGDAGRIIVQAPLVSLKDQADIQVRTTSRGNAGEIEVQVGTLALSGWANISASSGGEGKGGNLTVKAAEAVTLTGQPDPNSSTRLSSNAHNAGTGGQLSIDTPLLSLSGSAGIRANTDGSGNAGDILLRVGTLTMQGGADIGTSPLGPEATGRAGTVTVIASKAITLAGPKTNISSRTMSSGDAGRVVVQAPLVHLEDEAKITTTTAGPGRGGDVTMEVGTLTLITGATIDASTTGPGRGGDVTMEVGTLTLIGKPGAQTYIQARTSLDGPAGNIYVRVGTLTLREGAFISASSDGEGKGGNLTVKATEAVTLTGQPDPNSSTRLSSNAHNAGTGGQLSIDTPLLSLSGSAGIRANTFGNGNAGDILLRVGTLTMQGGADIGTSSFDPATTGSAGTVTVVASKAITLAGPTTELGSISSRTMNSRNAGQVSITAPTLEITDGGRISAVTSGTGNAGNVVVSVGQLTLNGQAQIDSSSSGAGRGGTVMVTTTDLVRLTGQGTGLFTRTDGPGQGGNITVQARRIALAEGATISAESTGLGNAGNVTIATGDTFLSTQGSVVTRATQADGGNIQITAPHFLRLRDSRITAEVGGGAQTVGGNMTIDPQFVLLQNSQITANAFAGTGGRIAITASKAFLVDPSSTVTASSTLGINGEVNIQTPVTNISGSLVPLPQTFAQSTALLSTRCAERLREGRVSRFVLGGRDGVPLEPGSLLLSPLVRKEQPGPAPLAEPVAGQREASFGPVGRLERPNTDSRSLRGTHAQAPWPEALDMDCARWRGRPGTNVTTVP